MEHISILQKIVNKDIDHMKTNIIKIVFALLCIIQISDAQTRESILVGAINYDALKGGVEGQADENSLSPPKWQHLLPFYAEIYNDTSRLVRTKATMQEVIYHIPDSDIMGFKIEAAFDSSDIWLAEWEIQIFTSSDNKKYDLFWARINDIGQDWKKVDYWAYSLSEWSGWIPTGTRYLKIKFNRVNNRVDSPQIMRVEINHGDQGKEMMVDEMDDFSKMYSHSENLSFASNNPDKFNVVNANSYSQEVMEQELKYAKHAGIDYMAYLDCPTGYPLNWGADLFLNTDVDINFCFIAHLRRPELESWEDRISRYVQYFKEDRYQKVLDGRPLFFIFDISLYSDEDIEQLREASLKAGLKSPYIVTIKGEKVYDAKSDYGTPKSGFEAAVWERQAARGNKVVPHISLGANAECRHENPPPWAPWGGVPWTEPFPKPESMVQDIKKGVEWVRNNPDASEINSILLYSWNEFAEGGAICPTKGNGTSVVDALHEYFFNK